MDPTFSFAWFDYVCGSRCACFSAPYSPCARPGEAGNLSALLYFFRLAVLEHGVASEDHVRIQQEKGSAQCVRTEDVPPVRRFFQRLKKKTIFSPGGAGRAAGSARSGRLGWHFLRISSVIQVFLLPLQLGYVPSHPCSRSG